MRSASRRRLGPALVVLVAAAVPSALAGACGGGTNGTGGGGSGGSGGAGGNGAAGAGGSGGISIIDGGIETGVLIAPLSPIAKVEIPLNGQTIDFTCIDQGTNQPAAGAAFTISTPELGTIDASTGVFTPNGEKSGQVVVTCKRGMDESFTTLTINLHAVDDQGGLTQQQKDALKGPPGLSDANWKWLYPYDGTVFPRGILAPEIHLDSGSAPGNAFYVHIVTETYEYEGFFQSQPAQTQLKIGQAAWDALTNSAAGKKVQVYISKLSNGQLYGPIFRTWTLAAGKLKGSIYYNTYDSQLASGTGAMMRIKGNSSAPEVLKGGCTVCHSVGADGSTAAATDHGAGSGTYDLSGGQLNPPQVWQVQNMGLEPTRAAFPAIFPKNGEVIVVCGAPGPSYPPNIPGMSGPWTSELRLKNGTLVPSSGIEGYYAQSPIFSHDGLHLAFYDRPAGGGKGVLAMMDYDPVTQKFTNYQVLAVPTGSRHLSWPAFTPDGKYVVYQDGTGEDLATWSGNTAKLYAIDVVTKSVTLLGKLNGDGYVPQGARDENKNYEPTILPTASGGYFWIMFTSRRTYGNQLLGSEYETKRLWVSAFDINAPNGVDGSHPGFYIAGQELTSGNSRGFWTLDACKADGDTCESGDECCNGFCNPTGDPPVFKCGPPDGECSAEGEACDTSADCCPNLNLECIGGFCSFVPPN